MNHDILSVMFKCISYVYEYAGEGSTLRKLKEAKNTINVTVYHVTLNF